MAMATSLALANPRQYDNVMSLPSVLRVSIAYKLPVSRPRGNRLAPTASSLDRAAFAADCHGIACRSTNRTRPSTRAADSTTRMFVRRDCLEPAEGSAHFDDLAAHRSPPHLQGEVLLGEDCGPAGDDDAED